MRRVLEMELLTNTEIARKAFNEDSRQSAYLLPLAYSKASAIRNSTYSLE